MADEAIAGGAAGAGSGGGGGGADAGVAGSGMSAADIAAPGGDIAFLEKPAAAPADAKPADAASPEATAAAEKKAAEEAGKPEEINLAPLEDAAPEWLAKVTDPAVKEEVQKLLDLQKAFTEKFKDAADLDAFFKDLPGGREQLAAMQTLSKEVGELDTAILENTTEGNATVAERYLGMAPDGGIGLLRAGAHHLAAKNPEGWKQVSDELLSSTLKAAGIGVDAAGLLGAISEMRTALQADDGEAFGKAAGKLLGAPKADAKPDPNVARLQERENAARAGEQKAQTESWQFRSEKSGEKLDNHIATETGKILSAVLPASIPDKDRAGLRDQIKAEVMSQLNANRWLVSQVQQLIGFGSKDAKGNADYSKANLRAAQGDFDKATEAVLQIATPQLIKAATAKIVSVWSRDRAASNKEAREKLKNVAAKSGDVGAAKAAGNGSGKKPLTAEQLRGMSDEDFLNY